MFWRQVRGAGCWRNVPGREDKILRTQWVGSPEDLPRSVAGPQQVGSHTGPGLGREGNTGIEVQASPGPSSLLHTVDPGSGRGSVSICHISNRACRHGVLSMAIPSPPSRKGVHCPIYKICEQSQPLTVKPYTSVLLIPLFFFFFWPHHHMALGILVP